MADYHAFPVWERDGVDRGCSADPATLPISAALLEALLAWASRLDDTLDWDDPMDTAWPTGFWAEFNREGALLAQRLRTELGSGYEVAWEPWGDD